MISQVYMIGVGGQGIGLLAEVLAAACDAAGLEIRAVDTHGLAQRGGTVESFLRAGKAVFSPLVRPKEADLVIALERTEALRGLSRYARPGGTLVYYRTTWQPLGVRLGQRESVTDADVLREAQRLGVTVHAVEEDLPDTRMQNVAVLAAVARGALISGVSAAQIREALSHAVPPKVMAANLELFDRLCPVSG